jgi:hypothetical protein
MFDFFFCDLLKDKIVYIIQSRSSTAFRSSIPGLGTKRDTSTLNDS